MIKYARTGKAIPHERVFKLDNDDLVIFYVPVGLVSLVYQCIESINTSSLTDLA